MLSIVHSSSENDEPPATPAAPTPTPPADERGARASAARSAEATRARRRVWRGMVEDGGIGELCVYGGPSSASSHTPRRCADRSPASCAPIQKIFGRDEEPIGPAAGGFDQEGRKEAGHDFCDGLTGATGGSATEAKWALVVLPCVHPARPSWRQQMTLED